MIPACLSWRASFVLPLVAGLVVATTTTPDPAPIRVDVMAHSVTGICSSEPVNTASYAVSSAPPGINGIFLLPEPAYKSILSSLANHDVAPIEGYAALSCNTTAAVAKCRKYTLPDETLADKVNHCVMLRNEQDVGVSANVIVVWEINTNLTFPPPPAADHPTFKSAEGAPETSDALLTSPTPSLAPVALAIIFIGLVVAMSGDDPSDI